MELLPIKSSQNAVSRFNDVIVHNANFVIDIHNPTGGGPAEELAASIAAESNVSPEDVSVKEIQKRLKRAGVRLFN